MTDTLLAWSAGVGLAAALVAAALDRATRERPASFRHAIWAAALGSAALSPGLLALAGWVASPPPGPSLGATWTESGRGAGLAALWIGPAALLALRAAAGWILAARLAARSVPLHDPDWLATAAAAARDVGLATIPPLAVTPAVTGPAVVGAIRPVILLPPRLLGASAATRRAVLTHELAHVARRDALVTRVATLARALHWFNPLVWWAVSRLDLAAECACDDAVVGNGFSPRAYARVLTREARGPAPSTALVGAGFGTAPVVRRLEALAAPRPARRPAAGERRLRTAVLAVACLPLLAASVGYALRAHRDQGAPLPDGAVFRFVPEASGGATGSPRPGPVRP